MLTDVTRLEVDPVRLAFQAPNRASVNEFYLAALTAGARPHSPPAVRRDEGSYFCASILDLDDHLIEVMYREDDLRAVKAVSPKSDVSGISGWRKDVPSSMDDQISRYRTAGSPKIIVNNVASTPAVDVYRVKQNPGSEGEISTGAIISTILGASAGAAVAYAMATSGADKSSDLDRQRVAYRTITTPPPATKVIHERPRTGTSLEKGIEMIDLEDIGTRVKTVASSRPKQLSQATETARNSRSGKTVARTSGTKASARGAEAYTKTSRAGPGREKGSRTSHSIKSARNIPLPASKVSTDLTPATSGGSRLNDLGTIVPDDSISQVSTRRSSEAPPSHRYSKSGHSTKRTRHSSNGNSRTVKASDRYSKKSGSHRR